MKVSTDSEIASSEEAFKKNIRESIIIMSKGYASTRFEHFVTMALSRLLVAAAATEFGLERVNELIDEANDEYQQYVSAAQSVIE